MRLIVSNKFMKTNFKFWLIFSVSFGLAVSAGITSVRADNSPLAVDSAITASTRATNTNISSQFDSNGSNIVSDSQNIDSQNTDNYAEAKVIKILEQKQVVQPNNNSVIQRNLQLQIMTGPLTGQVVEYDGVSDIKVVGAGVYSVGDKVIVNYSPGLDGQNIFYITDYVRSNDLLWLLGLFIIAILIIGRRQGLNALLSLVISFIFIIKVMVPLILHGFNPLLIGLIGSFVILLIIVYFTGGVNKKSHIALLSILLSLTVTAILAFVFGSLSHLTGTAQEEATYLVSAGVAVNFRSLLFAAIIIGTLGILDDVVVGQVEVVAQIKALNPRLPWPRTFLMSMKVGRAHLGAVVNTLFLAYVGVSLPLILLISLHQAPFLSFFQIVNNEQISTEIIRTLVGVIGLSLSVPITTWLATRYLKGEPKGKLNKSRPFHIH